MKKGIMKSSTIIFVFIMSLFLYTGSAHAFGNILSSFNSTYPNSTSGANASCQLCHGQSTSEWNEYGWGLRQNGHNFAALENLLSININGGTTNLDEINASTQPGWTTGTNNNLYDSAGLIMSDETAPAGIGGLDPPAGNQPPVADANGDPNGIYFGTVGSPVTFDGSGSSDLDGTIVSYVWDFGDGNTGTGETPSHIYDAAGSYTVLLTVTDNDGETDTASVMADIGPVPNVPPTADANGPYTGEVGNPVTFDGSASSDPDGNIVSYDWDFGDGNTGTGETPSHIYDAASSYTVSLTVTDDGGETDTATTLADIGSTSNLPPTADANGPYTGQAGSPVAFDGSGSSDPEDNIVSYDWDFGDGNTGTGETPSHTYAAADLYTVSLTVTDEGGASDTATTTATINPVPDNLPPIANTNGPYTGEVGSPVTFDGSGSSDPDGTIVSYDWDFGDGNASTKVAPNHTYAVAGTYTVSLTVTDNGGLTDTATTTATIAEVLTSVEPIKVVEVKVPKAINPKSRGVTPVKVEFEGDQMDLLIDEFLCGPDREGAQLITPKRLIQMKGGKAFAGFSTRDLGIQAGDTQIVCKGTLEADGTGTVFMGISNPFKLVGRDYDDQDNDYNGDRDAEDRNDKDHYDHKSKRNRKNDRDKRDSDDD
jgi:PKD repeat protein